jgi:predicted nucleotidyltransferase
VPVLAHYAAARLSVVGVNGEALPADGAVRGGDVHLLVEFAPGAAPLDLGTWLRLQREISRAAGQRVELITVDGLLAQVAEENISLIVLYDAASEHG